MASYNVLFDRDVEKDLSKIPKSDVRRIMQRILRLSGDPHPPQSLKLQHSDMTYRLRVGDYRVIYQIDDRAKIITIYHVRHRKDVYRTP
jgi:mRNA interferase RelE/StbE